MESLSDKGRLSFLACKVFEVQLLKTHQRPLLLLIPYLSAAMSQPVPTFLSKYL
jgi:hypothetical protein